MPDDKKWSKRVRVEELSALPPGAVRSLLPGWLGGYIEADSALVGAAVAAAREALAGVDDAAITQAMAAYAGLGDGYTVHWAHPVARAVSRGFMGQLLAGSEVSGLDHLQAIAGRPQVWLGNHLSYVDTQVTDALLAERGMGATADALLTAAGPKVYSDAFRRFAALGVNTLKTPQSAALSAAAGLSPRDVARIAVDCVRRAEAWRTERGPVLIYPEGTRSRSGHLGPFLRGVARYTRSRGEPLWIVPLCVAGTERLFPMSERLHPQPVLLRVGRPFEASAASGGKAAVLEEARRRLIALLPPAYRPG